MYVQSDTSSTFAVLAIVSAAIGTLLSLIRLCTKCASTDDQQRQSTTTATTRASVVPVQQRLPLTAQPVTRPFTSQPFIRPSPAAHPTSNSRSTVITIDDYEPLVPTYQAYLTYPPMPTSSSPSSSSHLSYPPLAATSLSPAPTCSAMSQLQPPPYPSMTRTQSSSSEADSTPPAYSASATS